LEGQGRKTVSAQGEYSSVANLLPHYREMAADGLRIAERAANPTERERYLLAAEYWNGRALEMERALQRTAARETEQSLPR
jgi:hypothetical protein